MNPRYRRLLIPGLLIALLVIVLVSSLARKADGAEAGPVVVSRIADARITESSGLALSRTHDDLAYTINDSNNVPYVFAIRVSTGAVVGATRLEGGTFTDTEAMAIDADGTLWIADTGDNNGDRSDVALYSLREPGTGHHTATASRYPLTYDSGPQNVEALLVSPTTGKKLLVSKGLFGGFAFSLPDKLTPDKPVEAVTLDVDVPGLITDGTFSTDGSYVVLRDYSDVYVLDASSFEQLETLTVPKQPQGESIAMESSGRSVLLGSEGADSALIRVAVERPKVVAPSPSPSATPSTSSEPPASDGFAGMVWVWASAAVAMLAGLAVVATRRRE